MPDNIALRLALRTRLVINIWGITETFVASASLALP